MANLKPYHWHTNNTVVDTWFERDRAYARLSDTRGQEIICLWDREIHEFISDGFKTHQQSWHEALCEYATKLKLTTK